jgi:hypothetical protein
MIETVTGYLEKALKTRHTGSALSPLLWLNAIVSVPCLLLAALLTIPMNIAFFGLALVIVLFSLFQYQSLKKIDPRLVQSEKLQFEMAKLDLVSSKGGPVIFDPVNIEFTSEHPLLSGRDAAEDEE